MEPEFKVGDVTVDIHGVVAIIEKVEIEKQLYTVYIPKWKYNVDFKWVEVHHGNPALIKINSKIGKLLYG